MFKARSVYIKIKRDFVEVTDLDKYVTVSKSAIEPFSSSRNIVSSFKNANETIAAVMKELGIKGGPFRPDVKVLIHQLEGLEGGLSEIEKRGLRDLAEMAGGRRVTILADEKPLTTEGAITYLQQNP